MAHMHTDPPNIIVTESIRVNRPAADVFAYVSTYTNDVHWRSAVTSMAQDTPGPARLGTTTVEVLNIMGNEAITVARIEGHEPGRRADFRSTDGPAEASGYRLVEPAGDGCIFTYHLELLAGLPQPIVSELAAGISAMVHEDLRRLKELLEPATVDQPGREELSTHRA